MGRCVIYHRYGCLRFVKIRNASKGLGPLEIADDRKRFAMRALQSSTPPFTVPDSFKATSLSCELSRKQRPLWTRYGYSLTELTSETWKLHRQRNPSLNSAPLTRSWLRGEARWRFHLHQHHGSGTPPFTRKGSMAYARHAASHITISCTCRVPGYNARKSCAA